MIRPLHSRSESLRGSHRGAPCQERHSPCLRSRFSASLKGHWERGESSHTQTTWGLLLHSMREAGAVQAAFAAYERATGLALNLEKCALLPLRDDGGDPASNEQRYAAALRRAAPAWAAMPIRREAKYLGMMLGPAVSRADRWRAPLAAFDDRLRQLASSHLAPSMAVRLFTGRVAPLLDYTASMMGPPPDIDKLMASVTERLWRLPHRSLPASAVGPMRRLAFPVPADLSARARRGALGAARRLDLALQHWQRVLAGARQEHGALASLADNAAAAEQPFWNDVAIVDELMRAPRDVVPVPPRREAARAAARARRARQKGLPPEAGPQHVALADALLPRLLRWSVPTGLGREQMHAACVRAIAWLVGCTPAMQIAVIRVWADAVATSQRAGRPTLACPACGREGGDRVAHMVSCATVRTAVAQACTLAPPRPPP